MFDLHTDDILLATISNGIAWGSFSKSHVNGTGRASIQGECLVKVAFVAAAVR
jgi:hypothetical protein